MFLIKENWYEYVEDSNIETHYHKFPDFHLEVNKLLQYFKSQKNIL